MKVLNCPECGLTVTDAQTECPKCHTKIEENTEETKVVEEAAPKSKKRFLKKSSSAPKTVYDEIEEELKNLKDKDVEINPEIAEEIINDDLKVKEEMIAAVVEAEALAIIEEEEAAEFLCETCLSPVDEGQNFCQLCGSSVDAIEEVEAPVIPKTDEESNKLIAAIGYVFFFFPILCGYYRNSAFAKFHAKQAALLFIASTGLFMGLVIFRTILENTFAMFAGHGVTADIFNFYLVMMIYIAHLFPFGLMAIGIINVLQGKKRRLPIIGRFLKKEDYTVYEGNQ